MSQPAPDSSSFWDRLPSVVWIFLILGGLAAFLGALAGFFYLITHVQGAGSLIMLVTAWAALRTSAPNAPRKAEESGAFFTALGVIFFAGMGLALDQPGNPIYNQPFEWFFCPDGTQLQHGVDVTHPVAGRTDVRQDFTCVTTEGQRVIKTLGMGTIIAVRFVEYIILGYVLLVASRLYDTLRQRRVVETG